MDERGHWAAPATCQHPLDLLSANSLDEYMKTLKTALTLVAVFAAMNATSMKADQPHMERALELLRQARTEIQAGTPTKGGHRLTAVEHINRAIDEVEKGITYDRQH